MRRITRLSVLLAVGLTACGSPSGSPAASPAASSPAGFTTLQAGLCHTVPVEKAFCTALTLAVPKATLRLAIADNADRRARGLMGAHQVPAGEGMLFVFPEPGNAHHEFWMKDTVVSLDMVFIGIDGVVTAVDANVPASMPGAADKTIARREALSKYVIEMRAGGAAAAGLQAGTPLDMPVTVSQ